MFSAVRTMLRAYVCPTLDRPGSRLSHSKTERQSMMQKMLA